VSSSERVKLSSRFVAKWVSYSSLRNRATAVESLFRNESYICDGFPKLAYIHSRPFRGSVAAGSRFRGGKCFTTATIITPVPRFFMVVGAPPLMEEMGSEWQKVKKEKIKPMLVFTEECP
jgi:hypothetical protein